MNELEQNFAHALKKLNRNADATYLIVISK